jgi:hypothetical protein
MNILLFSANQLGPYGSMAHLKVTSSLTLCKYGLVSSQNGLVTFAFS